MTALASQLILAIHCLEEVVMDLKTLVTLVDTSSAARAEMESDNVRPAGITEREHQLLVLLGAGLTNDEIADKVGIAKETVKNTLTMVYRKLHVKSRTEAALLAHELKLVPNVAPEIAGQLPRITRAYLQVGPNSRLGPNRDIPRTRAQRLRDGDRVRTKGFQ